MTIADLIAYELSFLSIEFTAQVEEASIEPADQSILLGMIREARNFLCTTGCGERKSTEQPETILKPPCPGVDIDAIHRKRKPEGENL